MTASPPPGRPSLTPTGATRVRPQTPPFSGRDALVVVACAALLVTLTLLVWVTGRRSSVIETVSPTVVPTVVHVPAGATRCPGPATSPVVLAGNTDTSCALALATAARVGNTLRAGPVDVASPVTHHVLHLTCAGSAPMTCRGDGAVVHLVDRSAQVVVGP